MIPGRYGRLSFADDGPGIPPALLARVFEPFLDDKAADACPELYVVHGIVRSWGGNISAVSAPSGGCAFEILLPIEDCPVPGGTTGWDTGTPPIGPVAGAFGHRG
jgi:signal transduction histidine kinase